MRKILIKSQDFKHGKLRTYLSDKQLKIMKTLTQKVPHPCYGKRDMRHAGCLKHGTYNYFNYLKRCPKCLEEEGKCPGCCRSWEFLKKKYSSLNPLKDSNGQEN